MDIYEWAKQPTSFVDGDLAGFFKSLSPYIEKLYHNKAAKLIEDFDSPNSRKKLESLALRVMGQITEGMAEEQDDSPIAA